MVDDEFLLLMCHSEKRWTDDNSPSIEAGPQYVLSVGDRKRLYDVGIRTAHEQPSWDSIEPAKGEFDWSYLDAMINRNRESGLKSLIQFHGWRLPRWIPDEWKAQRQDGVHEIDVLSMWNKEAQEQSDKSYLAVDAHYKDDLDVEFFFGEWQGSEGAYPLTYCYYDWAALEDYKRTYGASAVPDINTSETLDWYGKRVIEHFVRRGTLLYPKFKEVWNCQQHLMDNWGKGFGNYVQPDILKEFRRLYPDGCIVLLQYTYYDPAHLQDNVEYVDKIRNAYNCETLVEAMYCSGLPTTTPRAIAHGFRGQIVRPAFQNQVNRLENWHVNNIRVANELWRKHYEDSGNLSHI